MTSVAQNASTRVPGLTMQDEFGIVYLIETAQQFWSGALSCPSSVYTTTILICFVELEDILDLPEDHTHTLSLLDATLRRFLVLCSTYHGNVSKVSSRGP